MKRRVAMAGLLALAGCSFEVRRPVAVIGAHGKVLTGETVANLSGGRFLASNGATACSGTYDPMTRDIEITFAIKCNDGRRGVGTAVRDASRTNGAGKIRMEDGESARFVFGSGAVGYVPSVGEPQWIQPLAAPPDRAVAIETKPVVDPAEAGRKREAEVEVKRKIASIAYWRCIQGNAVRLSYLSTELADTVAIASLAACRDEEQALRAVLNFEIVDLIRAKFKDAAIGEVVNWRAQVAHPRTTPPAAPAAKPQHPTASDPFQQI